MKRGYDDGDILGMNTPCKKPTVPEKPNKVRKTGKTRKKSESEKKIPVIEPECGIDVDSLTAHELSRYSSWKKTVFSRKDVSEMVSSYSDMDFSDVHLSVISSCAKMFLGELIEDAATNKDSPRILTPGDIEDASSRLFHDRRNVLPDYCPLIKRKLYKIEKPKPEELEDERPFWAY